MGGLHRFEQSLEHMVTGAFARVFRSAVQPMEIAAALQREADNGAQILSRDRSIVPNDFTIELSGGDYDRLETYGQALSSELASLLHEHAEEQHYVFAGPVKLSFLRVDDLTTGRFQVSSAVAAQVTPAPHQQFTDTALDKIPLFLEIGDVRHPLVPPGLVVGRGSNTDLRVDDAGVSRRHLEFRVQHPPLSAGQVSGRTLAHSVTVVDLGSTNGTLVDGRRVQHAILTDGSVVQIGATRIVLRVNSQPTIARPGAATYPPNSSGRPIAPGYPPPQPYESRTQPPPYGGG